MCLVATRVPSPYLVQSAVDELDRMCACLDEAERSSSLVGKYTVRLGALRHRLLTSIKPVSAHRQQFTQASEDRP